MYLGYFICIKGILKDWRGIIGILNQRYVWDIYLGMPKECLKDAGNV
jgi:hypothetical protein